MQLIGILNCTPDSFFDGGKYDAIEHGERLIAEGADIIDVGGESTRPFAEPVPVEEELRRVVPVLEALKGFPLSIDTHKPEVAAVALEKGAVFLNDVTGFRKREMQQLAAESGVRICLMHMLGEPQTMQKDPHYPRGVVEEVGAWFARQKEVLVEAGVKEKQMVFDPGIGFGKTVDDNLAILRNLGSFPQPLMVGLSRKSFMSKILGKGADELLSTTVALNTMAVLEGASFIRVHDVKAHRDALTLLEKCYTSSSQ